MSKKSFLILFLMSFRILAENTDGASVSLSPVGLLTGSRVSLDYRMQNPIEFGLEYSTRRYTINSEDSSEPIKSIGRFIVGSADHPSGVASLKNLRSCILEYSKRLLNFLISERSSFIDLIRSKLTITGVPQT